MDVGNHLGNAESNRRLSKNMCAAVCAACGLFWKSISFVFLGISVVSFSLMTAFGLSYWRGWVHLHIGTEFDKVVL